MKKNFISLLLITLPSLTSFNTWAAQETIVEKELRQLLQLIPGEFNNHNQINFQTNDFLEQKVTTDYSRLHQRRQLIQSSKLKGDWVYSQINRTDRDGKTYRQSFHNFYIKDNQIRSKVYKLKNPSVLSKTYPNEDFFSSLSSKQLTINLPAGCDTLWQKKLDQFVGTTNHETCIIQSKYKDEKRQIFSEEIIGTRGFWSREGGYTLDGALAFGLEAPNYYRFQRARPMTCWAAINISNGKSDEQDWEFYRDLQTHDEGGTIRFGKAREYRLQLRQTEFPATDWSDVFEIFIYRDDDKKAFAYSWTEPSAKHIAVNLRKVQASCKLSSNN